MKKDLAPFMSEIVSYWQYKTLKIDQEFSGEIHEHFEELRKCNDFVGMDMEKKFMQMGYTKYRNGRMNNDKDSVKKRKIDEEKQIFQRFTRSIEMKLKK